MPPPVLKPSQIDRLRVDPNRPIAECRQAALEVFCAIQTANEVIERIGRVVESGFCVGLGGLTASGEADAARSEAADVCGNLGREADWEEEEDSTLGDSWREEQLSLIKKCRYCQKCKVKGLLLTKNRFIKILQFQLNYFFCPTPFVTK